MISWMTTTFSQLGVVLLAELDGDSLIYVGIGEKNPEGLAAYCRRCFPTHELIHYPTALLKEAAGQIDQYLHKERQVFTLPLALPGTDFQQEVWGALSEIPYGQTSTYGEVAKVVGAPKAMRAVGQACGANPIPLIVPCHRVLARGGGLGGYSGGLSNKRILLAHEGISV